MFSSRGMGWYRSRLNQRGPLLSNYLSLTALTLPLFFLCIQLSTLGSLSVVGQKLSKGRDMEIVSSRERITEGIRLYVSTKL